MLSHRKYRKEEGDIGVDDVVFFLLLPHVCGTVSLYSVWVVDVVSHFLLFSYRPFISFLFVEKKNKTTEKQKETKKSNGRVEKKPEGVK